MQEKNTYLTGTRSNSSKTGFLTDIYIRNPQAENGVLFSGIVDLRLNF